MTQVKNLINKVALALLGLVMVFGLVGAGVPTLAQSTINVTEDDTVADLCEFTNTCDVEDESEGIGGIVAVILNIVQIAIYVVGAIAVLFLVYGGFLFIVDPGGSGDGAEKGKKIIFNALIGLVIVVLSTAIVQIVTNIAEGISI